MNKRKITKNSFTLVELLVAMAVFSILLLISMQIFGSSRKLWLDAESKNRTYNDIRNTMEFISSRIQTMAYTEAMPFLIKYDADHSTMYFPTAIPMNRKDENGKERDKQAMRFVGFSLGTDGILRMHIYSDEGASAFQRLMPPFVRASGGADAAYTSACNTIANNTINKTDYTGKEYNVIELAENVHSFILRPFMRNGGARVSTTFATETNSPPYRLDIILRVSDSKANYENIKNAANAMEKTELHNEHLHIFQRSILLNYRGAR